MQARAVVIAIELIAREREMRVGMRAVHDHFDPSGASHLADPLYRKDLARKIRDMADVDDLGARRDRRFKAACQIVLRGWRHGKRDLLQDDAVPSLALFPCRDHA